MVAKSRKKSSTSSHLGNSNMSSHQETSLPQNKSATTGKNKRSNPSALQRALNLLQRIFSVIISTSFTLTSIAAIIFSPLLDGDGLQPTLLQCASGYLFILHPLLSSLSVCLQSSSSATQSTSHQYRNAHEIIIASSFLLAIICNQFPKWASCSVASCTVLAFGLASRQLTHRTAAQPTLVDEDEKSLSESKEKMNNSYNGNAFQKKWANLTLRERAALSTLAVVTSLLLENFLIWVVSATYEPGIYDNPTPLQDNGRIVLEQLAMKLFDVESGRMARRRLQSIRDALNVQWAIVAGLGASFVCLELNLGGATSTAGGRMGRSLAGLALHALMTLASARLIRTISFVLTVLPSQVPDCYRQHFPMPPGTWKEWLLVGFLPNSRGGCNDLILSGHATVLTTLGCACTSVANNTKFSVAVWTLVAVDFGIESYQGLHYSVDMWLGCIVTCLLWQLTKGLEVAGEREQKALNKLAFAKAGLSQVPLDGRTVATYATPAFLGFIILTFVSETVVNYFLVGYAVWAGAIFFKWGFTNFSQHILLCLLFVTLGSYL